MRTSTRIVRLALAAGLLATFAIVEGGAAHAVSFNNLSFQGTLGRIRVRPVFQDATGATVLQQGDATHPATNPNRTVGDDALPLTFNTPGPRSLGNNPSPPVGHGAHTHYHAGDTRIVLNDVSGFRRGDTILIGSPYCNFEFLGLDCQGLKPGVGLVNEQPFGQVAHVVGGDTGLSTPQPGVLEILPTDLKSAPRCFTALYDSCAFVEGQPVVKLPTLHQGQQFRVDIPHFDIVAGSPNDVVVTAEFLPPQGARNPSFPRRPLALNRDNPTDFDVIVDNACGVPAGCGAGFVSFYIPKEITGNATIGNTFNLDLPNDDWYTVEVTARDITNPSIIRADGAVRFKLNPTAIQQWSADRTQVLPGESVNLRGTLTDDSSAVTRSGFDQRPVEDVVVDVELQKPGGGISRYQVTSCVDTVPGPSDRCGSDPFGAQTNGHGGFQVRVGGAQGLFLGVPDATINCQGQVNIFNPATYPNLLNLPGCISAPILSVGDTLQTGTYQAIASLRGYIPAVTSTTIFDVIIV